MSGRGWVRSFRRFVRSQRSCRLACGLVCVLAAGMPLVQAAEPLASWRDGVSKEAILSFVAAVTQEGSKTFVPVRERLAVFDNDGTLWPECPLPFELAFALDEVRRLANADPELAADPMIQAAVSGDLKQLVAGEQHAGLVKVLTLTHAGMSSDEFARRVDAWLARARHPRFGVPYDQLTYRPMQEVLALLREKHFKVAIVSGGGVDFMRQFAERVYGVEPEWVLGSSADVAFEIRDGRPEFIKKPSGLFVNDKVGKSVRIYQQLGRRPIACFGNSDGDQSMMEYTTRGNRYPAIGVLVHHTDELREYGYDKKPPVSGRLVSALEAASQHGWTVVDMQDDWKTVFGPQP
jgi:phosphoserine phosphatase